MSFSTLDYERQSQQLADVLKSDAEERKLQVIERISKMSALDHFKLLRTVIKGHLGAQYIKISSSIPITTNTLTRSLRLRTNVRLLSIFTWRVPSLMRKSSID
jgi:hypothetical protein